MHPADKFEGEERMTGDLILDGLLEVFPEVNFSTLIEVSISFKDDIDGAADYIIHNVLPNIIPDGNDANTNEDSYIHGHQQVIGPAVNDTLSKSIQFVVANKYLAENEDSPMGEQLMQSPVVASTSGHSCLPEERNSDSLLPDVQNSLVDDEVTHLENQQKVMHFSDHLIGGHGDERMQCSSSEKNPEIQISEDNLMLHDDGSTAMFIRPNCYVNIEPLDGAIASENCGMHFLMSNVAAISEMVEEVELNEAKTKYVVSEASQAGRDILVKAEKLKEMSKLAEDENSKVAGEVFAEKSILASEAQGLKSRLFNISEQRENFVLIIDEMHQILQRRLAVAEVERAAAETEKSGGETMAQEMLKEQEVLLDAAKEESKKLEQQAKENAKLRELLMDRGYAVDALHGELLGIFDKITQLQCRVDTRLPANQPHQLASSSMCSSVESSAYRLNADEPVQLASPSMSSSVESSSYKLNVDEPLQLASSSLPGSVKSAPSKQIPVDEPLQLASSSLPGSVKSAPSKQIPVDEPSSAYRLNADEPVQLASPSMSSSVESSSYKLNVDEPLQLASSSLPSSVKSAPSKQIPVDEPLQLASSSLPGSVKSAPSKQIPVDEPLQLASSSLTSSVKSAPSKQVHVDEPLQLASSSLTSSVQSAPSKQVHVDEPLQLPSSNLSRSVESTPSKLIHVDEPLQLASSSLSSSVRSATSGSSWSSASESNLSLIADASSHSNFASDDSWDVVETEEQCLC